MSDWTKFVKAYAAEYNLSYAAAMQQARGPYKDWKETKQQIAASKAEKPDKRKKREPKKQIISSDSDSDSEVEYVKPKKKRQPPKKAPPKKTPAKKKVRYISSSEDSLSTSGDDDSDVEYIPVMAKNRRKVYYYE